jgi:putative transposase
MASAAARKTVKQSYAESLKLARRPALTAKAKRIRKFNLGRRKQRTHQCRQHLKMERQINTAVNQVVTRRTPAIIITEKPNLRGKAKSKQISRRVSLWMRGILKKRVEFEASAEGFRREQINPAYASQLCRACWFLRSGNRHGDAFKCLYCGHTDAADRMATTNLKARWFDPDIHLFTPKEQIKEILLARFNARLEREGGPPPTRLFRAGLQAACANGAAGERNDCRNLA